MAGTRTSNLLSTFYALGDEMFIALRADDDVKAQSTARILLEFPELPLLLRIRAYLVLASGDIPDYLEMAYEAVRVAEIANGVAGAGEPEQELLGACKDMLNQARAHWEDEADERADEDTVGADEVGIESAQAIPDPETTEAADTVPSMPDLSSTDKAAIRNAAGFVMSGGHPIPSSSKNVSRTSSLQTDPVPQSPSRRTRPALGVSTASTSFGSAAVAATPTTALSNTFTSFGIGAGAPASLTPQTSSVAPDGSRPATREGKEPQTSEDTRDDKAENEKADEDAEMLDGPDSPEEQH